MQARLGYVLSFHLQSGCILDFDLLAIVLRRRAYLFTAGNISQVTYDHDYCLM
jgi:hypothetical protein